MPMKCVKNLQVKNFPPNIAGSVCKKQTRVSIWLSITQINSAWKCIFRNSFHPEQEQVVGGEVGHNYWNILLKLREEEEEVSEIRTDGTGQIKSIKSPLCLSWSGLAGQKKYKLTGIAPYQLWKPTIVVKSTQLRPHYHKYVSRLGQHSNQF